MNVKHQFDKHESVLSSQGTQQSQAFSYSSYGYDPTIKEMSLGFNGEHRAPWTNGYALGQGYRFYNTVLMRFNSPDSYSPFVEGVLNAYAYCVADPINHLDRDGHMPLRPPSPSPSRSFSRSPPRDRRLPPRPSNPVGRTLMQPQSPSPASSRSSTTSFLSGDEAVSTSRPLPSSFDGSMGSPAQSRSSSSDQSYHAELDFGPSSSGSRAQSTSRSISPVNAIHPAPARPAPIRSRRDQFLFDRNARSANETGSMAISYQRDDVRDSRSPSR